MAKREDDTRFLKSEKNLIGAAAEEMQNGKIITVTNLCQRAGVFVSTFYRHYHNLNELMMLCKDNLIKKFDETIATNKTLPLEKLFEKWAIFIYQNRDTFYLSVIANQLDTLLPMLQKVRPIVTNGWRSSPQKLNRVYLIYSYEVMGVWMNWVEREHFDVAAISRHTKELTLLTRTALQRLGGVIGD